MDNDDEKKCILKNNSSFLHIQGENLTFEEFYTNVLMQNIPCLLSNHSTCNWNSRRYWVTDDGTPNFNLLKKLFGDEIVPVADCKVKQYDAQLKKEMKFSDFLNYWEYYISKNYDKELDCWYLKDWHFCRSFPEYSAYDVLPYFSSDWLNEYWDQKQDVIDDYRFVYMGPKGSWTPFHADVFRSYSWSANICGRKRWILCSPTLSKNLLKKYKTQPYDILSVINFDDEADCLEIIQQPGEIIFVPSNWYHQVYNLDDCISINHNWFNGANIDIVWKFLQLSLKEVEKEIADCSDVEDWSQQCQVLLKAVQGMDFIEFCNLLMNIGKNRIEFLKNIDSVMDWNKKENKYNNEKFEIRLAVSDLEKIYHILHELINFPEWKNLVITNVLDYPEKLIEEIQQLLVNI